MARAAPRFIRVERSLFALWVSRIEMGQVQEGTSRRYLSLDVWRGVACLMVVLDHVAIPALFANDYLQFGNTFEGWARWLVYRLTRLGLGPPLFFVISGYCIASSVDSLRRKGKPAGQFLYRRLRRTYPPYWVALGLFVVVLAGLDALGLGGLHHGMFSYGLCSPHELDWYQWAGNLTLTETWRPLVWGHEGEILTRVGWSLCFQEQFYFISFLVMMSSRQRFFRNLLIASIGILGFHGALWNIGNAYRIQGLFPTYWHEFAVGLAVYWRLNEAVSVQAKRAIEIGLAAMVTFALANSSYSAAAAAGFGLLLIAVRPWDARLAQVNWLAPVRACGRRCYSIYLVHMLVCSLVAATLPSFGLGGFWARTAVVIPVTGVVSVAAGWVFYHLVESRFLNAPATATQPAVERPSKVLALPSPVRTAAA